MSQNTRHGFTLIELIVVVLIIILLLALLLPATRRVREASDTMLCNSNLRQLVASMHHYHYDHKAYPTGCTGAGTNPETRLSWIVAILPYMEEESLFNTIEVGNGFEGNLSGVDKKLKNLLCPSAAEPTPISSITHYVAMAGVGNQAASQPVGSAGNGFMGYDRLTTMGMITAKDGISNTIALMETLHEPGPWARGGFATLRGFDSSDLPWTGAQRPFDGPHVSVHAVMVDGSIRDLPKTLAPKTLAAAVTIAGGEQLEWE